MWTQGLRHLSKACVAPGHLWWHCPDLAASGVSTASADPAAPHLGHVPGSPHGPWEAGTPCTPPQVRNRGATWEDSNPGPEARTCHHSRTQTGLHHPEHPLGPAPRPPQGPSAGMHPSRGSGICRPAAGSHPRRPECPGSRVPRSPARAGTVHWPQALHPLTSLRWGNGRAACRSAHRAGPKELHPSARGSGAPACNENGALDSRPHNLHSHGALERTWAGEPGTLRGLQACTQDPERRSVVSVFLVSGPPPLGWLGGRWPVRGGPPFSDTLGLQGWWGSAWTWGSRAPTSGRQFGMGKAGPKSQLRRLLTCDLGKPLTSLRKSLLRGMATPTAGNVTKVTGI